MAAGFSPSPPQASRPANVSTLRRTSTSGGNSTSPSKPSSPPAGARRSPAQQRRPNSTGRTPRPGAKSSTIGRRGKGRRKSDTLSEQEWKQLKSLLLRKFGSLRSAFVNFNTDARREAQRGGERNLDVDELKRGLAQVGVPGSVAVRLVQTLDLDGNGQISCEEFSRAIEDNLAFCAPPVDVETQTEEPYDATAVTKRKQQRLAKTLRTGAESIRQDEHVERQILRASCENRRFNSTVLRMEAADLRDGQRAGRHRVQAWEVQERDNILLGLLLNCAEAWAAHDEAILKRRVEELGANLKSAEELEEFVGMQ
eukprot:Hpha_TRINITY_DN16312_c1_g6::TRINITY_DN16312_c1_g6_i6::g.59699::m.59699